MSALQKARLEYLPVLPEILHDILELEAIPEEKNTSLLAAAFPKLGSQETLGFVKKASLVHHPLQVGVVLSGGQAAGGHNVITGLFDALKKLHPSSRLFGFLNGPQGIIHDEVEELTREKLQHFRNQGGFDLIGSGRDKIETKEQFEQALTHAKKRQLDGIVVIGGDDSNTNAALLAEYFLANNCSTKVIGVPKTIDGDLKNQEIEISFGFDTAAKTFAETIGNILRDSLSAGKYYFFIKLMGRSASHLALECALATHPTLTLIGEEIAQNSLSFSDLVHKIADVICKRASLGKNFGVVLIPEGVIEFIPEFQLLIQELNRLDLTPQSSKGQRIALVEEKLSDHSKTCFDSLPEEIQSQLMLDRDPHGNIQVSKIETERLFISAVAKELEKRKGKGEYKGKFNAQPLFCGYEGRAGMPSNFDANYCYALGHVAALLIDRGKTGYMSCVKQLSKPAKEWKIAGIPLSSMIHMEERKGSVRPVIKKALVDLKGQPFLAFQQERGRWETDDEFLYPGPLQFFGPQEITDSITVTLSLESQCCGC